MDLTLGEEAKNVIKYGITHQNPGLIDKNTLLELLKKPTIDRLKMLSTKTATVQGGITGKIENIITKFFGEDVDQEKTMKSFRDELEFFPKLEKCLIEEYIKEGGFNSIEKMEVLRIKQIIKENVQNIKYIKTEFLKNITAFFIEGKIIDKFEKENLKDSLPKFFKDEISGYFEKIRKASILRQSEKQYLKNEIIGFINLKEDSYEKAKGHSELALNYFFAKKD